MPARKLSPRPDWPALAAALATAIPRARLHPSVLAWTEAATASRRTPWAIGFSGGADSLTLLLLLWAHWPERRARLRALHFDHRLRGTESTADARFCREVCRALDIEFISERWNRPLPQKTKAKASDPAPVSEAAARAARHAFFAAHARVVWLGHQQDDIAESMLMRLARGSGLGGLAAPRPVQSLSAGRVYLRPLLTLKKAELLAALRAARIPWREDSTNAGGDFFRNRVRRDILPVWTEVSRRDALAGAARSRTLLEEDEAALDAWVERLEPLDSRRGLILAKLDGEPRAIVRRALHRWVLAQRRPIAISSQAFESLLTAVEVGRPTRHSLGSECFGEIAGGALRLVAGGKLRSKFHRRVN